MEDLSKYRYGYSKVVVVGGVEMMRCFDKKFNCWKVVEMTEWFRMANEEVSNEGKIRAGPADLR